MLGYDASGVVEDIGNEVTLFKPGDQVFYAGAMDQPDANSELHLVAEHWTVRDGKLWRMMNFYFNATPFVGDR